MLAFESINNLSIEILENLGVEVEDKELLSILKNKGIKVEDNKVFFTKEDINRVLNKIPNSYTVDLYNNKAQVNDSDINYINIGSSSKIRDYDGNIKTANLEDYIKSIKIIEQSKFFNTNGSQIIDPLDIDKDIKEELLTYINLKSSKKQLVIDADKNSKLKECLDLVEIAYEKAKGNVFVSLSNKNILSIDKDLSDKIKVLVNYKNPILLNNIYNKSTDKISLEEEIALYNANILATISIIGSIDEDSTIIYSYKNNKSNELERNLVVGNECVKLAKNYNMLSAIEMPSSFETGANFKSGCESMLSLSSNHQENPNIIITTLGMQENYNTMSFEKVISDMEVLSMANYVHNDMEVNEKTLALKAVEEAKDSGSYITLKHTAKNCRKYPWFPTIAVPRKNVLSKHPVEIMRDCINDYEKKLISSYTPPTLNDEISNKLYQYMENLGVDKEILNQVDEYLK